MLHIEKKLEWVGEHHHVWSLRTNVGQRLGKTLGHGTPGVLAKGCGGLRLDGTPL